MPARLTEPKAKHSFALHVPGIYRCRHCAVRRRTLTAPAIGKRGGAVVHLYRERGDRSWTTERPRCTG